MNKFIFLWRLDPSGFNNLTGLYPSTIGLSLGKTSGRLKSGKYRRNRMITRYPIGWVCILFSLFFTVQSTFAQEQRYRDAIFPKIEKDVHTYSDTLKLDFYFAKEDTTTDKPLLLLVHGGGFAGGKRDNVLEGNFSRDIAKRGYAVASISYRLTRKGKSFGCDCPTKEKIATFLSASEDILRATQYLVDRANDLKFDKDTIILIGSSAGAEAVLNTIFMRFHHDFRTLPYGDLTFSGVISLAGAVLDIDYITQKIRPLPCCSMEKRMIWCPLLPPLTIIVKRPIQDIFHWTVPTPLPISWKLWILHTRWFLIQRETMIGPICRIPIPI